VSSSKSRAGSKQRSIEETKRRRELQRAFNAEHGVTPRSVVKSTEQVRFTTRVADARTERDERGRRVAERVASYASEMDDEALIALVEQQMREAAANLDFEAAAALRDQLFELKARGGAGGKGDGRAGGSGGGSGGAKRGEGLSRIRAPR